MWHVYLRRELFIVPIVVKTVAGYYLDVDPVTTTPCIDDVGLATTLEKTMAIGHPVVATPSRANFPKPAVLQAAGIKSWSAFEKSSTCWTIRQVAAGYAVSMTGRGSDGKWTDNPWNDITVGSEEGAMGLVSAIRRQLARESAGS